MPLDSTGRTLWNRACSMAGTVTTWTGCVRGQLPRLLNTITAVWPSGTCSLLWLFAKKQHPPSHGKGAFFSSSLSFANFDSWVHESIFFPPLLKVLLSTADFCLLCAQKGSFPHSLVLSSPPFLYRTFTNLFTFVRSRSTDESLLARVERIWYIETSMPVLSVSINIMIWLS